MVSLPAPVPTQPECPAQLWPHGLLGPGSTRECQGADRGHNSSHSGRIDHEKFHFSALGEIPGTPLQKQTGYAHGKQREARSQPYRINMGFSCHHRAGWRAPISRQDALSCTYKHRFVPVTGQIRGLQYGSDRETKEKQRLDSGKERRCQADRNQDSLRSHSNLYSETASSFSLRINCYFSHLLSS